MSNDSSSRRSENNTNPGDRRRRRAERNRMRTIKHVHKLLDQVGDNITNGFNHSRWTSAAGALKQVSAFLAPEEYHALGKIWRETYASEVPAAQIESIVSMIKERVEGKPFSGF